MTGWELFFWLLGFCVIGWVALIFLYIGAKLVTFGILKAKRQFKQQTESEESDGSEA